MKKNTDETGKYILPVFKAAMDIPTFGFFGAIANIFENQYREQKDKNLILFNEEIVKKIQEINLDISEVKKRIEEPEFMQLFIKILTKIQYEHRTKIRQIYSNFLINLIKEDKEEAKVNFDQNIFFLDILETLNEDHLKILSIFYKDGIVKNRYPLRTLHEKTGCYIKRKIRPGESLPLSNFIGEKNPTNKINALDPLKGAYFEGLLSDLNSKKLISIETKVESESHPPEEYDPKYIIDSIIHEKFVGTELGSEFYKFIMNYK